MTWNNTTSFSIRFLTKPYQSLRYYARFINTVPRILTLAKYTHLTDSPATCPFLLRELIVSIENRVPITDLRCRGERFFFDRACQIDPPQPGREEMNYKLRNNWSRCMLPHVGVFTCRRLLLCPFLFIHAFVSAKLRRSE